MIHPSNLLRRALFADAAVTAAVALLQTFGAGLLTPMLNLPQPLLLETGLFLIAYTALVGWLATRQAMPKALVTIVIAGNAAWAIGSIALMFSGAVTPSLPGYAFVALHAISTGVFAELHISGCAKAAARSRREDLRATHRVARIPNTVIPGWSEGSDPE